MNRLKKLQFYETLNVRNTDSCLYVQGITDFIKSNCYILWLIRIKIIKTNYINNLQLFSEKQITDNKNLTFQNEFIKNAMYFYKPIRVAVVHVCMHVEKYISKKIQSLLSIINVWHVTQRHVFTSHVTYFDMTRFEIRLANFWGLRQIWNDSGSISEWINNKYTENSYQKRSWNESCR